MHHILRTLFLAACWLTLSTGGAQAQQVYRCEFGGKVSYAHEPCVGAQAVDTTPTEGMNQMTGVTQKGADVYRDEHRRLMYGISSQITGLSPETYARIAPRYKLPRSTQLECAVWDQRLPSFEQAAAKATPAHKAQAELALFHARQQFRDLRC